MFNRHGLITIIFGISVTEKVGNQSVLYFPPHLTSASALPGKGKGKGFPYSIPSVGHGADPGVQAVSLQVTVKSSTRR